MKNIAIAYITDNNFCLLTRTSINSIIKNSNKDYKYNIYVICVDVYESEKESFTNKIIDTLYDSLEDNSFGQLEKIKR